MKKKKFLVIVPRFHTNLYYQVQALQEEGHEVRVVALYKGFSERYEGIELVEIGYSRVFKLVKSFVLREGKSYLKSSFELRFGFPSLMRVRKEIVSFGPDVIFLKAYLNIFFLVVLLANSFCKNILLVLTQTKKDHIKGSKLLLRSYFLLAKWLGAAAYISPITKTKEVLANFNFVNVHYVPFIFPLSKIQRTPEEKVVSIMTVGKFVIRKEILLLLKAFRALVQEGHSNLRLNIFGEKADLDYARKVEDYIRNNGLDKIVNIRYNLRHQEVLDNYSRNSLFVLPSSKEPAAYAILEAMGYGLPVICSNECGTKCYIDGNGCVFQSGNSLDLKEKIKQLLFKDKLEELGKKSAELVALRHEKKMFVRKIEDIITKKKTI